MPNNGSTLILIAPGADYDESTQAAIARAFPNAKVIKMEDDPRSKFDWTQPSTDGTEDSFRNGVRQIVRGEIDSGNKVKELVIFGHSDPTGTYTGSVTQRNWYKVTNDEVLNIAAQIRKERPAEDLLQRVVMLGCNTLSHWTPETAAHWRARSKELGIEIVGMSETLITANNQLGSGIVRARQGRIEVDPLNRDTNPGNGRIGQLLAIGLDGYRTYGAACHIGVSQDQGARCQKDLDESIRTGDTHKIAKAIGRHAQLKSMDCHPAAIGGAISRHKEPSVACLYTPHAPK